jgi:hypothetical protein
LELYERNVVKHITTKSQNQSKYNLAVGSASCNTSKRGTDRQQLQCSLLVTLLLFENIAASGIIKFLLKNHAEGG